MAGIGLNAKRTYTLVPASTTVTANYAPGGTQTNSNHNGARITINVASITGTSVTYTITGVDPISGLSTGTILASAAQAAAATIDLIIFPGATVTANRGISSVMPLKWKITTTGTWTSLTHSVYVELFGV